MGCDIHTYVEVKSGSIWRRVPPSKGPKDYYGVDDSNLESNSWSLPRNYMLFGILAGVRRDLIPPMIPPRGFPEDVSNLLKQKLEDYDYHSFSYYTLTELLDFKNKTHIVTGFVNIEEYKSIKKNGYPEGWYQSVVHKNFTLISNEEMERIVNLLSFIDDAEYYTETIWEHPYSAVCPFFWNEFISAMEKLDSNTDNVRFLFCFDN